MPTPFLDIDSHALAAWTTGLATLLSELQALLIAAIMRAYVSSEHGLAGCLLLIAAAVVFALFAAALRSHPDDQSPDGGRRDRTVLLRQLLRSGPATIGRPTPSTSAPGSGARGAA